MIKEYQDLINNYSEWLKQKIRIESIISFRQYRENRRAGRQLQGKIWNDMSEVVLQRLNLSRTLVIM